MCRFPLFFRLQCFVREKVPSFISTSMAKGKKTEDGEWAKVEKSMQEVVNKRRLKVQKLEQELDAYRKHYAKLLESFSVPTFPEGT